MKRYILTQKNEIDGCLELQFRPRSAADRIDFTPGQYIALGFRGHRGKQTPLRSFSLTNIPQKSGELSIAMKIGGAYTQKARHLELGSELVVEGPYGEFVLDARDTNVVMIAGGIGITPMMSLLRQLVHLRSKIPVSLIYSTKNSPAIFDETIAKMALTLPNFHLERFVSTRAETMTPDRLRVYTGAKFRGATYFVCGPKKFTRMIESTLQNAGIDDDHIVVESFSQSSRITGFGGLSIGGSIYALSASILALSVGVIGILDISRNGQTQKTAHIEPQLTAPQGSDDQMQSDQATQSVPTYTDTYQPPMSHVS